MTIRGALIVLAVFAALAVGVWAWSDSAVHAHHAQEATSSSEQAAASPSAAQLPDQEGRALFVGERPLAGHVQGHDEALPTAASRCSNCHSVQATATASGPTATLAPVLDNTHLAVPQPRRGGPPSKYDAASLCTLLRTGVDPAAVLIDRVMPRYEVEAAECGALWRYLTRGGGAGGW